MSNCISPTQFKRSLKGSYLTESYNAIKIVVAILGIVCALAAVFISILMYRRHLRRRLERFGAYQEVSVSSSSSYRNSTSFNTPLTMTQQEQFAVDFEANLDSPPSPVMQQSLLQRELIRNYGCNLQNNDSNILLKPPPYYPRTL